MKKFFVKVAVCATLFCGAFGTMSCSEKEDVTPNNDGRSKYRAIYEVRLHREDVDTLAKEVAMFHDTWLRRYLNEFRERPVEDPHGYIRTEFFDMWTEDIQNTESYGRDLYGGWIFDTAGYMMICEAIGENGEQDIMNIRYNQDPYMFVDIEFVRNETAQLVEMIEPLIAESRSFEDFQRNFEAEANRLKGECSNINEYLCISFAAAVCANSFEIWTEEFFEGTIRAKDVRQLWGKVKKCAKEVAQAVKPYVVADMNGAVVGAVDGAIGGAVAGSMAGGVGAGPGAAAGAVAGAAGGAASGSVGYALNH